jgi:hypothetical protein
VVDSAAHDTARTFGSGEYDAVVFHEGVVAEASLIDCVKSRPMSPRAITVESAVTRTPLTVGTAITSTRTRLRTTQRSYLWRFRFDRGAEGSDSGTVGVTSECEFL